MHADATLTLRSPTLAAEHISLRLALDPDTSWEPGDSLARRRSPRTRRGDHGWAIRAHAADPSRALGQLLTRIGPAGASMHRLVADGDAHAELVLFTCDGANEPDGAVESEVARVGAALGTGLVPTGATGATSARIRTWASAGV